MKKYWCGLLGVVLLFSHLRATPAQALPINEKISPQVWGGSVPRSSERARVIVMLRPGDLPVPRRAAPRAERLAGVVASLREQASAAQRPVVRILERSRLAGRVERYTPLWITNAVAVTADRETLEELASLPEVTAIIPDREIPGPAPMPRAEAQIAYGMQVMHVQSLWARGFTGQGIVVASLDTGVDGSHPDLASRWRGGANSWFDPYGEHPTPTDLNGHGTWTMGVMVGGDTSGTPIGVAPGATWIAARIFNNQGAAQVSAIHLAYQWILDPDGDPTTADAPHVVNNSWGFQYPTCDLTFEPDLLALRAAGILPIFAAGNAGPGPNTSTSPANNPSAFSVGATDGSDGLYTLSSQGSTDCGQENPITFPHITAPGVQINTTSLHGGYFSASGTSLASPHAAGVLALLLDVSPSLPLAEQERLLSSAVVDLGPAGADNQFGAGRLDAWMAYNLLAVEDPSPTLQRTVFLPIVRQ